MGFEAQIRRDAKRVAGDREAAALLACLVEHLFDPDLDMTYLGRVCGAPREVRDRLAAVVGPLKAYVTRLRMLEAARRVRETDLPIAEIARKVGYRVPRTFRRAFKEYHDGVAPGEMRRRARAEEAGAPDRRTADPASAVAAAEELDDSGDARMTPRARAARLRRRHALGLLDAPAAGELRSGLRRRHPELEAPARDDRQDAPAGNELPIVLMPTGDHLERYAAGAVFDRILALPAADLRPAVLDGVRLANSPAFEVLLELCRGHTRWNRERAVAVAELGVQLLALHRPVMGEEADDWMAFAWAGLGRVKMLASDFEGAGRALGFAFEETDGASYPTGGTRMAPWVELEVRRVEGMVLVRQGRGELATAALDRAVELGRSLPLSDRSRALSVAERLELASFLGQAEAGFELSAELEALIEAGAAGIERTDFWRGLAAYHRGKAHAAGGRDDLAEACWRQAGACVAADQDATEPPGAAVYETAVLGSFVAHELARLAGRYYRNSEVYETLLRSAISRYRLVRASVFEAAAEAELAALLALCGRGDEARPLAASAGDFLDRLPSHRRAWNAAARLRALVTQSKPVPEDEISAVLAPLCDDLDSVRWEITGAQASPAAAARRAEAEGSEAREPEVEGGGA